MKKHYEVPTVEKITFNYRDQVVVASAGDTYQNETTRDKIAGFIEDLISGGLSFDEALERVRDYFF